MYQLDPKSLRSLRWRRWSGIGSNVFFLGITSMLTDVSSEMVTSILPIYLVFALGLTPLQFGFVDGLSQGAAALARLASGLIADRWQRNREVAALGYGISAVCKLVLLAAGNAWGLVSAAIAFDRVGKGIRTSPRDALISLSSIPERLGLAFGIHRALDTAGALIGPLVAFAILAALPQAFDLVFVTSFFVAIAGLAALLCFVRNVRPHDGTAVEPARRSLKAALALLRHKRFRAMVLIGTALGLFTVADSFVFLMLQRKLSAEAAWFPLFYVAVAVAYLVLAIPAGSLGDRFGRARMFLVGHALLLLAGINLLMSGNGLGAGLLSLALLGAYYACTDGVLMAMASRFVPSELRASGLGLVATANGVARLVASIMFGALWNWRSMEFALTVFTVGLAGALVFSTAMLARTKSPR
jgi:MFS family permease